MGYRSDVKSLIYGDVEPMKVFMVKTKMLSPNNALEMFKDNIKVEAIKLSATDELLCIELHCDCAKWYDSYEDVQAWEALLKEVEKDGLDYEFVRVGEENGDVEQRCSTDASHYISVNTYSEISY